MRFKLLARRIAAPALGVALGSCAGLAVNFLSARHLVFKSARKH